MDTKQKKEVQHIKINPKALSAVEKSAAIGEFKNRAELDVAYEDYIDRTDPVVFDHTDLRASLDEMCRHATPKKWNIYINNDGDKAHIVHKELRIRSTCTQPQLKGCGRQFVEACWWNFVVNVFGKTAPKS